MSAADGQWQRTRGAIAAWVAAVRVRHSDLLRTDPGYGRDLAAGIGAVAKVLLAHPAVTAAAATLAAGLLKAPARSRQSPPRPGSGPRLWEQDWDREQGWDRPGAWDDDE